MARSVSDRRDSSHCSRRVRTQLGIRAAEATTALPVAEAEWAKHFTVDGRPAPPSLDQVPLISYRQVTPDYFRAMGASRRRVAGDCGFAVHRGPHDGRAARRDQHDSTGDLADQPRRSAREYGVDGTPARIHAGQSPRSLAVSCDKDMHLKCLSFPRHVSNIFDI